MQNNLACPVIDNLHAAIHRVEGPRVSLSQILDALGQRSFGILLLIVSVPAMLPVPGLVSLFGIVLLLLGVQMLLGFTQPWLPREVRHRPLPKAQLLKMLRHLQTPLQVLQPYIHRRLPGLVRKHGEKLAGLFIIVQAIFIIIPLPFTNEAPALCIALLAVGFIQQDGALALLAHLLALLAMAAMLALYGSLILAGYMAFISWL
jgi:hypothetical protein